jgi:hypothetical protein
MDLNQVDPDRFRHVMGCFATGVAVITTAGASDIHGMTANAFISASLSPCRSEGRHACTGTYALPATSAYILERRAAAPLGPLCWPQAGQRSTRLCLLRQNAGARTGGWHAHRRHCHHIRLGRPHAFHWAHPAYGGGGAPTLVVLCRSLRGDQPAPADRGDRASIVLVSASVPGSGRPAPAGGRRSQWRARQRSERAGRCRRCRRRRLTTTAFFNYRLDFDVDGTERGLKTCHPGWAGARPAKLSPIRVSSRAATSMS